MERLVDLLLGMAALTMQSRTVEKEKARFPFGLPLLTRGMGFVGFLFFFFGPLPPPPPSSSYLANCRIDLLE